jgi:quercetin dioxygenase-like cupin family protein
MIEHHRMRVLITGTDAERRSVLVGEEYVELNSVPGSSGFWFGQVFETTSTPPPARQPGQGDHLEVGLAPGLVRWQVIDYEPGQSYPMHHTDTVDFDVVLQGSIELTLDDGTHILQAGDGVVIAGVDHAWAAGPDGARLSVLFVGTPPPA